MSVFADPHPTFPDLRLANDMTLMEAALFYVIRCKFRIIMLEEGGKAPHHHVKVGWTKLATRDPETVKKWWGMFPKANIGFMPDNDFAILDLDIKGLFNGVEKFQGYHEHVLGPTQKTPSGGVHRIFRRTDDKRCRNYSPREGGFDLLVRAKQAVVAPSVILANHTSIQYRWTQGGEPAPMPVQVMDRVLEIAGNRPINERAPEDAPDMPALGHVINYNAHPHELRLDDRSEGMYDLARHLFRFFGDRSDADIMATVWAVPEYEAACIKRRLTEGSALSWLWEYTIWPASGHRIIFPVDTFYDPRTPQEKSAAGEDIAPAPWEAVAHVSNADKVFENPSRLSQLMVHYDKPPEFVIPHWFPKGVLTTIFGKDGTGKTMLMQRVCTLLAAGKPVMGKPAGPPVKCMLMLTEDIMAAVVDRQKRICRETGVNWADLDEHLVIPDGMMQAEVKLMTFDRDLTGKATAMLVALGEYIERDRPELVVLDPISDIYADEENRREKVSQFMRALNSLAEKHNIALILLGHPAKAEGSEYSGSTAWSSKSRSRVHMMPVTDKPNAPVWLKHQKASYGARASDMMLTWSTFGTLRDLTEDETDEAEEAMYSGAIDLIMQFIRDRFAHDEVFSNTAQSADRYLPRAMVQRNVNGTYSEHELKSALSMAYQSNLLLPNIAFDGEEGRPARKDAARRWKRGVWFAPKNPTKTPAVQPTDPDTPNAHGITQRDIDETKENPPSW